MFADIHYESIRSREAELRRIAAEQRQVRAAVGGGRGRNAAGQDPAGQARRGAGESEGEVTVRHRGRRLRRASATGGC